MERDVKIRAAVALFEGLVRRTVDAAFRFPAGGAARRAVAECLRALRSAGGGECSDERLADFCICQVYALSRFDAEYLPRRWRPSHSFGPKARERFAASTPQRRYWEDRWLQRAGLARTALPALVRERREHPLWPYLDPAYEEHTKRRVLNTPVGYYVCGISTLLWNPFSACCAACTKVPLCRRRTAARYPELYRLRCEEAQRRGVR